MLVTSLPWLPVTSKEYLYVYDVLKAVRRREVETDVVLLQEYEQQIVETVAVYEVVPATDELIPVEAAWGAPPKYETLQASKVLVFDFGSELYVYNGKNAPFETRKVGARLA